MTKKCDCSCGCQLTSDETYFEELESVCQGCNKGYRETLPIKNEICQICDKPAYGLCNDDCGFLCIHHNHTHRHETGHITIEVSRELKK
jgi:hypothetical protein